MFPRTWDLVRGSNLWLQITVEIIQSWVAVQMTQCLTISFLWRQISTFSRTDKRQRKIRKIFKISVTSVTRQQMSLRVAMNEPSVGAND